MKQPRIFPTEGGAYRRLASGGLVREDAPQQSDLVEEVADRLEPSADMVDRVADGGDPLPAESTPSKPTGWFGRKHRQE